MIERAGDEHGERRGPRGHFLRQLADAIRRCRPYRRRFGQRLDRRAVHERGSGDEYSTVEARLASRLEQMVRSDHVDPERTRPGAPRAVHVGDPGAVIDRRWRRLTNCGLHRWAIEQIDRTPQNAGALVRCAARGIGPRMDALPLVHE